MALRPYAEALYSRRTKTLILILKDQRKLTAPRSGGLALAIASRPVEQLFYRSFVLKNKTGRTLREFQLEFEMHFDRGALSQRAHFEFEANEGAVILRDEDQSRPQLFVFSVRHFDRGQESSGRILSTHPGIVRCRANNELEVKLIEERRLRLRFQEVRPVLVALVMTLATVLLVFLFSRGR